MMEPSTIFSAEHAPTIASALTLLAVALDKLAERRRRRRHTGPAADQIAGALAAKLETRVVREIADVAGDVKELRALLIGADGRNGIRGQLEDVRTRVGGIEERELARLERQRRFRLHRGGEG
jgi:hypothetical protein